MADRVSRGDPKAIRNLARLMKLSREALNAWGMDHPYEGRSMEIEKMRILHEFLTSLEEG
jgi:hypothetical protein